MVTSPEAHQSQWERGCIAAVGNVFPQLGFQVPLGSPAGPVTCVWHMQPGEGTERLQHWATKGISWGNGGTEISLLCETQQISIFMTTTYLVGDSHMWEVRKAQPVPSFTNQTRFLEDFSSHGAPSTLEPNSKCSHFTDMAAKLQWSRHWRGLPVVSRHFSTLSVFM